MSAGSSGFPLLGYSGILVIQSSNGQAWVAKLASVDMRGRWRLEPWTDSSGVLYSLSRTALATFHAKDMTKFIRHMIVISETETGKHVLISCNMLRMRRLTVTMAISSMVEEVPSMSLSSHYTHHSPPQLTAL